jgi:hypothetical protein
MPLIKARSSSLMNSIDLRGTPTAATAAAGTSTTQLASTGFVSTEISNLVNSAPTLLDTLDELAAAIGDDASFSTTMTTALSEKVALAGGTMTGALVLSGAPANDLEASTKKYVDDGLLAQLISSTDDVPEGTNNLYHTTARVRAGITLSSDNTTVLDYDSATGVIAYAHPTTAGIIEDASNLYYTDARVRAAISLTTTDSTILSYSNTTGAFTFAEQDTDKVDEGSTNLYFTTTRARDSVSAGTNVTYNSATGVISADGAVVSVNGADGIVTIGTDDVDEGSSNLYFSDTRARNAISLTSTDTNTLSYSAGTGVLTYTKPNSDGIAEGTTNLYFLDSRARAAISASGDVAYNSTSGVITFNMADHDTDDLAEGTANLYFLDSRARGAISVAGSLAYNSTTGVISYTTPDTDGVDEGSLNLYYTDARARASISAGGDLSYVSSTGVMSYTTPDTDGITEGSVNLYYTDARTRAAISVTGDLTYNGTTGAIGFALADHTTADLAEGTNLYYLDSRARAAISVSGAALAYDNTTGVLSTNALVASVNTKTGVVTLTTDDINEGSTNLYYTDARVRSAVSLTSDDTTVLSYSSGTGAFTYAKPNTDKISEGTTNLYFTDARARAAFSEGTGVSITAGEIAIGQAVATTDNVTFNDLVVDGDLTINGTTTTVNTATLDVEDINITVAKGAASAAAANGAGLTVDGAAATILYVSATDTWDFNKDVKGTFIGDLTGDVVGDLTGDVTGTVSDISNHDTDALSEGTANLYYTDGRSRAAISVNSTELGYDNSTGVITYTQGNTDGVAEGSTNLYFSDARARGAISVSGDMTYNSTTGVIGFALADHTTTDLAEGDNKYYTDARARASISVTGDLAYVAGTGVISYSTPDTDGVTEGTTNLYYTDARVRAAISGSGDIVYDSATGDFAYSTPDTDGVDEGTTNLYHTTARARATISASDDLTYDSATGVMTFKMSDHDTDDLSEGTANLYYTDARVHSAISLTSDDQDIMSYDNAGGFTFAIGNMDTDDVTEGTSNLYFTTGRARASVSAGSNISYDSATGVISTLAAVQSVNGATGVVVIGTDDVDEGSSNLYYTDARAQASITMVSDDTTILSYASGTGTITYVTPDTDAINEGSVNEYFTNARADARIAAASIDDLSDVDTGSPADGAALVWSSSGQKYVTTDLSTTTTAANFTANGTDTDFDLTSVVVDSIENTTVFINGIFQAPTYSYTISNDGTDTTISFDAAPEANDIITVRYILGGTLNTDGILNESSTIDGGTY